MARQTQRTRLSLSQRDAKLRELILLIATRSEGDKPFGAVKLNKLLFYTDFLAYLNFGEAITGQEYQKLPQGPAPRRMLPVLKKMIDKEDLAIRRHDYYGKDQQRAFALTPPDMGRFNFAEIELIDRVVEMFWGKNASEMSAISHQFLGWKLAAMNETIPYSVALVGSREPTAEEQKRGLALESLARQCKGEKNFKAS